ncbi:hypothetical protein SETIT_9G492800v2 [Setaria italica]|uniref:4-hydroxy-7-methoxy-3-oxo-3,4-dihydro-2H-1,4-benzoxazin-2-yl glucosidebeta-D-glucosidase n=1 Tax=Setaria italica TaxID=4555 RepID=A0A368SU79_SETIT|nr:hypothetical protein SETIT_9G492800v2 [Setaria italica]
MGSMESGRFVALLAPLSLLLVASLRGCTAYGGGELTRGSFPEGFVFGTAASAYQPPSP